jgi:hypothetical protein
MYSTTAYLYQQITRVLLIDTSGGYFTARYDPVYAKQLTVNKGVDNVLLFEFINQDQKPVNITGSTFVFRLLNQTGDSVLLSKEMETLSASLGRVKVVLNPADTDIIVSQPGSYSIVRKSGNYEQAVFVDANAGARADCNIVDSLFPQFIPSKEVTSPEIYGKQQYFSTAPTSWPDWALTPQPLNGYQTSEFYSSYVDSTGASVATFKMDLIHYTGTIKIQGAANYEAVWYNATEISEYFDHTGTIYINVLGYHPLMRVAFNNQFGYGASATATVVDGVVTSIELGYAGNNYIAPPLVQILGDGAGATAVATLTGDGTVAGITVTNGGAGYVPIQLGSNLAATVFISNGLVQNIEYR